jgi:hypothetical protein
VEYGTLLTVICNVKSFEILCKTINRLLKFSIKKRNYVQSDKAHAMLYIVCIPIPRFNFNFTDTVPISDPRIISWQLRNQLLPPVNPAVKKLSLPQHQLLFEFRSRSRSATTCVTSWKSFTLRTSCSLSCMVLIYYVCIAWFHLCNN